jgi:hypothetical protein
VSFDPKDAEDFIQEAVSHLMTEESLSEWRARAGLSQHEYTYSGREVEKAQSAVLEEAASIRGKEKLGRLFLDWADYRTSRNTEALYDGLVRAGLAPSLPKYGDLLNMRKYKKKRRLFGRIPGVEFLMKLPRMRGKNTLYVIEAHKEKGLFVVAHRYGPMGYKLLYEYPKAAMDVDWGASYSMQDAKPFLTRALQEIQYDFFKHFGPDGEYFKSAWLEDNRKKVAAALGVPNK